MSLASWAAGGPKDLAIRAVKTAITTFIGVAGADVAGWTSVSALETAGIAALSAAATVVLNALLNWATKP